MKIMERLSRAWSGFALRDWAAGDDRWYGPIGRQTISGVDINPSSAMAVSAVFCALYNLVEGVAMLPIHAYRAEGETRQKATDHPVHRLLHDSPNSIQTPMEFKEWIETGKYLYGTGYAYIDRDRNGRPLALWPLKSASMNVSAVVENNVPRLLFEYRHDSRKYMWDQSQVFYVTNFACQGLLGLSLIDVGREAIASGIAQQKHLGSFYRQGAKLTGVLEHPGELGDDGGRRLRESWQDTYGGLENAHKVAILEEGMKYNQISISPQEAQMLESMTFTVQEVARVFNISPHRLMDLSRATFSNIEQMGEEYVRYTLMPHLVRFEQRANLQLFSEQERMSGYFLKFNPGALLRGDAKSRSETHKNDILSGVKTPNEARAEEDLPPIDGGDELFMQGAMTPVRLLREGQQRVVPAEPQPAEGGVNENN